MALKTREVCVRIGSKSCTHLTTIVPNSPDSCLVPIATRSLQPRRTIYRSPNNGGREFEVKKNDPLNNTRNASRLPMSSESSRSRREWPKIVRERPRVSDVGPRTTLRMIDVRPCTMFCRSRGRSPEWSGRQRNGRRSRLM
jgi:hypothetical protein